MSLTPVAPTGEWRTTLARSGSSTRASRPSTRAASTWRGSAGGRSSCAPPATGPRRRGRCARLVDMVGDRGHHFPGDPYSVVRLVPGDLVGGQPKKWRQRAWPTARAWLGQLPHGVDVAAQAATRDGAAWPGPGVGGGRGGRDPRGRARGGRRPPTPGEEGAGGHCGRGAGPPSAVSGCSGWPMPQPTAC